MRIIPFIVFILIFIVYFKGARRVEKNPVLWGIIGGLVFLSQS